MRTLYIILLAVVIFSCKKKDEEIDPIATPPAVIPPSTSISKELHHLNFGPKTMAVIGYYASPNASTNAGVLLVDLDNKIDTIRFYNASSQEIITDFSKEKIYLNPFDHEFMRLEGMQEGLVERATGRLFFVKKEDLPTSNFHPEKRVGYRLDGGVLSLIDYSNPSSPSKTEKSISGDRVSSYVSDKNGNICYLGKDVSGKDQIRYIKNGAGLLTLPVNDITRTTIFKYPENDTIFISSTEGFWKVDPVTYEVISLNPTSYPAHIKYQAHVSERKVWVGSNTKYGSNNGKVFSTFRYVQKQQSEFQVGAFGVSEINSLYASKYYAYLVADNNSGQNAVIRVNPLSNTYRVVTIDDYDLTAFGVSEWDYGIFHAMDNNTLKFGFYHFDNAGTITKIQEVPTHGVSHITFVK
ncbi:MAG: hypothetical protein KDC83_09315 [Flavobacteriales bacterium]|nr:hypothetical protein [Flavobacteriales bacterium]